MGFAVSARTLTIRIPRAWAGVSSKHARLWLLDFCRDPKTQLPLDPGPGPRSKRVSFSVPKRAVKFAAAALDEESESAVLRRIIASRMMVLPPAGSFSSLSARGAALLPLSVPSAVVSSGRALPVSSRYRVAENGGWIALRSLEREAMPLSPNAPSESSGFGVWMCVGILVVAFLALLWLLQSGAKGVVAAAPVSSAVVAAKGAFVAL